MIFNILLWVGIGVVTVAFVGSLIYHTMEWGEFWFPLGLSLGIAAITAVLWALGMLITIGIGTGINPAERYVDSSETYDLRALGSDSTIEGRQYFLGGGYINTHRVLNYIKLEDEGFSTLAYEWAEDSRIFEDADEGTSTVTEYKMRTRNPGWYPWTNDGGTKADFRIPEGSVLESYTITNE